MIHRDIIRHQVTEVRTGPLMGPRAQAPQHSAEPTLPPVSCAFPREAPQSPSLLRCPRQKSGSVTGAQGDESDRWKPVTWGGDHRATVLRRCQKGLLLPDSLLSFTPDSSHT